MITHTHTQASYLRAHSPALQIHSPLSHTLVHCHSHRPQWLESPKAPPTLGRCYPLRTPPGCTENRQQMNFKNKKKKLVFVSTRVIYWTDWARVMYHVLVFSVQRLCQEYLSIFGYLEGEFQLSFFLHQTVDGIRIIRLDLNPGREGKIPQWGWLIDRYRVGIVSVSMFAFVTFVQSWFVYPTTPLQWPWDNFPVSSL